MPTRLLWLGALVVGLLAATATGRRADDTRVLLTKAQALRAVFPHAERALEVRRLLAADEKLRLEKTLRRGLEEKGFLVYLALRGDAIDGIAVITNEIGKTEPITFIVGANLDGTVGRVAVMVYRETHGGEVQARRFLAQFEKKSLADPIELHRDVISVSGATLSAAALCSGTRKVLAVIDQLCLQRPAGELLAEAKAGGAREVALRDPPAPTLSPPPVAAAAAPDARSAAAGGLCVVEARRLVMGSELRIAALVADASGAEQVQQAFGAAERLDAVLSDWREDSELARVNRDATNGPVTVSPDLLGFLTLSAELWQSTRGAFDPSIGELVRTWGFRGGPARRPGDAELAALVAGSGFAGVRLDATTRTVEFTRPHVLLDPGAIGKGMAVDAVIAELQASGITNAIVDFGSTQRAIGGGEEGLGWPVALRDPATPDAVLDVLFLRDRSCSTSGGTEKFVELDGRQLPHILDPRTGAPAQTCAAAIVLASTAARADALSTALFVLGPAEGAEMIDAIEDAAGILVPLAGAASLAPTRTTRWPGAEPATAR